MKGRMSDVKRIKRNKDAVEHRSGTARKSNDSGAEAPGSLSRDKVGSGGIDSKSGRNEPTDSPITQERLENYDDPNGKNVEEICEEAPKEDSEQTPKT